MASRYREIRYNDPDAISSVAGSVGATRLVNPRSVSIHARDGRVLGAVVFERIIHRRSCFAHVAARHNSLWASREFLEAVTDYAFNILQLEHVYSEAPADNQRAMRFNQRMGMRALTTMPDLYPTSDGVLFHVERATARFLTESPTFELRLRSPVFEANEERYLYDLGRGLLFNIYGERVSPFGEPAPYVLHNFKPAHAFSPNDPAKKSRRIERLKIQLGLGCNYGCSYCMQSGHRPEAVPTGTKDVEAFVSMLRRNTEGPIQRFEFWGGEPLVYWAKLRKLIELLREHYPTAMMGMVTNGSLLTEEIAEFLCQHDINVSMSHDGPAHRETRGEDPLDKPEVVKALQRLHEDSRLAFICVLTEQLTSINDAKKYIADKVGFEPRVGKEGVVRSYNGEPPLSKEALLKIHTSTVLDGLNGAFEDVWVVQNRIDNFLQSIHMATPMGAFGQSCAMDKEDWVAVDLLGNVITCQNVGAESHHRLGHLTKMEEVTLHSGQHWSHRPECRECPVLTLCRGSCLYLDDRNFEATCANEKAYNMALLTLAMYSFTGKLLQEVRRV